MVAVKVTLPTVESNELRPRTSTLGDDSPRQIKTVLPSGGKTYQLTVKLVAVLG